MTLAEFLGKQFIRVIQWNESEEGTLSYRFPMRDMEIENGGQLTVRESQLALFVNEGRIADEGAGRLPRRFPRLSMAPTWTGESIAPPAAIRWKRISTTAGAAS